MTREEAQKFLPLIQAFAEGKDIQIRYAETDPWRDVFEPQFDFEVFEYRIKPEPRVIWVSQDGKVFGGEGDAATYCQRYEVTYSKYVEVVE